MRDAPESPTNMGIVCDVHAPQPQAHLATMDPQMFVGRCVKRAFGTRQGPAEHMWVIVDAVTPDGHLQGRLDNDPVYDCGYVCGDAVTVLRSQIEAVDPPV